MRIATYNIWNSDCGMPLRADQIIKQIMLIDADILCLQEVKNEDYHQYLNNFCKYPYSCFFTHNTGSEGLSIFSKFPLTQQRYCPKSIITLVTYENYTISLTNLHLTWDSALKREKEIVSIAEEIELIKADYAFMVGDFNCNVNSSIHAFLTGQQSLLGKEANPCWYDLSEAYSERIGLLPEITLDFQNNTRWNRENTIEVNQRFDRILLKNTYPNDFPKLIKCAVFGKSISKETGCMPSDHYGVYVDVSLSK